MYNWQYEILLAFKLHLFRVREGREYQQFQHWACELDRAGISWAMQNRVSELCNDPRNDYSALSDLLGIKVINKAENVAHLL